MLPDCKDHVNGIHKHILPKQQDIVNSTAKLLYCQGGVGSAKTVAFAARCVDLCFTIPDNVGAIGRKDYPLLFESAWLDVKKCLKRAYEKGYIEENHYKKHMFSRKKEGEYTRIEFENGSVISALETKNILRGLGAGLGFFWIDDAMESDEYIFVGDETNAGLISRLRIPNVRFARDKHGQVVDRLSGMVSTNPPPIGHWLHKLFGTKPGIHKLGDDDVEWIQVATHENPFMGEGYAKTIMSVQNKMGRTKETARRIIFGESVPAYGGIPVFPEFDHVRHVGQFKLDPKYPIVRSWDFGFHHPAVVFSLLYKCENKVNHYISLSEVADSFALNIWDFYADVKEHTDKHYHNVSLILDGGDRAGYRKSDSNKDKRGPIRILRDEYKLSFKYRYLDLSNSLEYMRSLLKKKCKCGMEYILISKNCPVLIGALEGGYKYSKTKQGKISDKPVEDRYFADLRCVSDLRSE